VTHLRFTGSATADEFRAAVSAVSYWYHSFRFTNGYEVRGDYDIAPNVHEYGFGDVAGLDVLDVGSASGWFSAWLEQQGARLTTFDLVGTRQLDTYGEFGRAVGGQPDAEWVKGATVMGELLGSRAERFYGRIYELPQVLGDRKFDLVFMGALLLHLRDPIGALMAARSVCRARLIATTWFIPDEPLRSEPRPICDLPALDDTPAGRNVWWRPNRSACRLWLEAAGFCDVDVGRTVTLTADTVDAAHFNSTQTLLLAHGHV
jgi:SAM-dependent methyltransferase